jgi:hypothetical protein
MCQLKVRNVGWSQGCEALLKGWSLRVSPGLGLSFPPSQPTSNPSFPLRPLEMESLSVRPTPQSDSWCRDRARIVF